MKYNYIPTPYSSDSCVICNTKNIMRSVKPCYMIRKTIKGFLCIPCIEKLEEEDIDFAIGLGAINEETD